MAEEKRAFHERIAEAWLARSSASPPRSLSSSSPRSDSFALEGLLISDDLLINASSVVALPTAV